MGDEPMNNFNPMSSRIKCLDNDELIKLLSEELKKCVKETCRTRYNRFGEHEIYNCWIVSDEYQYDDSALDKIERQHQKIVEAQDLVGEKDRHHDIDQDAPQEGQPDGQVVAPLCHLRAGVAVHAFQFIFFTKFFHNKKSPFVNPL